METLCNELLKQIKSISNDIYLSINTPAGFSELQLLEETVGVKLPQAFSGYLSTMNGQKNTEGNENVYTQMYVLDDSGAYQPYGEPQRVGTRRVTVKYMPEGGSGTEPEIPVGRGSGIEIWFDRATGGFKEDKSGNLYDWIRVEGGSKNYKIVLTKLTGKSEVVPEAAAP